MKNELPKFPVSEIFGPTIQGEGAYSGRIATFIRFAGCDSKCDWCDTKYAWDTGGAPLMTTQDIAEETFFKMKSNQSLVILTGGNPAIYDLAKLVKILHLHGCEVHVETQGTKFPKWLSEVDFISFSPKPIFSEPNHDWIPMNNILKMIHLIKGGNALGNCAGGQLKFIVGTDEEYLFARAIALENLNIAVIFQPKYVDPKLDGYADSMNMVELVERMCQDTFLSSNVKFAPQLHRILWSDRNGV